jgi:integrase
MTKQGKLPKGMSIKNGIYYFRQQICGKRKSISLETTDFREACERKEAIQAGEGIIANSIESYIEEYIQEKITKKTYTRFSAPEKKGVLERIAKYCGLECPLIKLSSKHISSYFTDNNGLSSDTLNGYKSVFQAFLNWCQDDKDFDMNKCLKCIKGYKFKTNPRKDHLEMEEIEYLISNASDADLKYILICGLLLGMRKNEIIESKTYWFNKNRDNCFIQNCDKNQAMRYGVDEFRIKNGKERLVYVHVECIQFINDYLQGKKDGYCMVPDKRRGKSKYRYNYDKKLKTFLKLHQMEHVYSHMMRRSFGTALACNDELLENIAAMLGDSMRTTESHYATYTAKRTSIDSLPFKLKILEEKAAA